MINKGVLHLYIPIGFQSALEKASTAQSMDNTNEIEQKLYTMYAK